MKIKHGAGKENTLPRIGATEALNNNGSDAEFRNKIYEVCLDSLTVAAYELSL